MEILFLIGNGFDINLDMSTSYSDFCTHYQKIESTSHSVKKLKNDIKLNVNTWSDLELRLGAYMENFENYEQFEEVYDDLLKELGDYLQFVEDKVNWSLIDTEKFKKYLCHPEESLPARDFNILRQFKDQFINSRWYINVVTYNYTRSIEKLLEDNYKNINI